MHELEEKENASKSLLLTREPGVGPVAELGEREHPWTSLAACFQPAFKWALQQDSAQELLGVLRFSFRNHFRCQAHPELSLCQEKTARTAGADGDSSHQLSRPERCRWDSKEETPTDCLFSCGNRV